MQEFEPIVVANPFLLAGTMNPLVVVDPDAGTPNTIIETDNDWFVKIGWSTSGLLSNLVAAGIIWHIKVYLESMDGSASPGLVASHDFDALVLVPPDTFAAGVYGTTLKVSAGTVNEGLYRLNVAITTMVKGFLIPQEMAAFSTGPLLQFYNP